MRTKHHSFELLLVLFVFCIYAAGSLFLCVMGANTYRETTAIMQADYDLRTGVMYLAEKTRQSDVAGGIHVERIYGVDALVLTEQITGRGYETWIFVHNGMLCEEFIASGAEVQMDPPMLQTIMPMRQMELVYDSRNILTIDLITIDGTHSTISLNIKSAGSPYNFDPSAVTGAPITPSALGGGV